MSHHHQPHGLRTSKTVVVVVVDCEGPFFPAKTQQIFHQTRTHLSWPLFEIATLTLTDWWVSTSYPQKKMGDRSSYGQVKGKRVPKIHHTAILEHEIHRATPCCEQPKSFQLNSLLVGGGYPQYILQYISNNYHINQEGKWNRHDIQQKNLRTKKKEVLQSRRDHIVQWHPTLQTSGWWIPLMPGGPGGLELSC